MNRPRTLVSILAAAFVTSLGAGVLLPSRASAQVIVNVGESVGERGLFTSRGFDTYCKILRLDASQKELARELMDGTTEANRAASDEMRVAMKAFGDKAREAMKDGGLAAMQKMLGEEMPAITNKYSQKRIELEKQFFEDVKGMLTAEQAEHMPRVERFRRREAEMRGVRGNVDLVDVLDTIGVEASTGTLQGELGDAVARYESSLDPLLVERSRLSKESEKKLRELMPSFNIEALEAAQKPLADNGNQIKDLGRQAARTISAALPEDKQAAFMDEVRRREFPRVYRQPHVVKAMEAALGLPDLDQDQKKAITELKEQYERRATTLNDTWAKAIDAQGDSGGFRIAVSGGPLGGGENPEKEINEAKKARTEFDSTTEAKLKSLLKEEQVAKLPAKRPERTGGGPMGDWDDAEVEGISVQIHATEPLEGPVEAIVEGVMERKNKDR